MALFTSYYLSLGCPLAVDMWGLRPLLSYSGLASLGDTGTFQEASLPLWAFSAWGCQVSALWMPFK